MLTTVVSGYPKIPNRPRPARLRNALNRYDRGELTWYDVRKVMDEVTIEVINEQVEAGLDLINDGLIRWEDEQTYICRALSGIAITGLIRYFDTNTYYRQPVIESEIRWEKPILVEDWKFAAAHSPKPVKAVLTGPYTLARLSRNAYYSSLDDAVMAFARALNQEVRSLQDAGVPFLHINEPAILSHKEDIGIFELAMSTLMEGVSTESGLYVYFGDADGVIRRLLELPFDLIGLDFVSGPRNFEVLRSTPFTKALGAGLVNARNTRMESVDTLTAQARQLAEVVPLDRMHLSPNCSLEFLPRETAQAKLARMVEAARQVVEVVA
jgi:5-methyltetrahydropteroyltriglutamate--homocysteine methyltransferase